jgi:hypothetical protein
MPMRKLLFIVFAFTLYFKATAQIQAVTGTGDVVVLYENHTWKYLNKLDTATSEIQTNPKNFTKNSSATFEVLSNRVDNTRIYIDPKKWKFKKGEDLSTVEYAFTPLNKEAYGMLVTEKIQVPIESLRNMAIENAMKAAPDVKLDKEEYRNVNGTTVLALEMSCTLKGVPFTYLNYYYSSESGTVELITFTSTNLFKGYKASLEELLNGLVIIKHTR